METENGVALVAVELPQRELEGDDLLFEQNTRLNAAYREIFRVASKVTDTITGKDVPQEILSELAALVSCARKEKERFLNLASAAFPTGGGK